MKQSDATILIDALNAIASGEYDDSESLFIYKGEFGNEWMAPSDVAQRALDKYAEIITQASIK